jgi:hypothetical protein
MTWALMGLLHRQSRSTEGWAWVDLDLKESWPKLEGNSLSSSAEAVQDAASGGDSSADLHGASAITATAMAQFVENSLRQLDAGSSQQAGTSAAARRFDAVAMATMGVHFLEIYLCLTAWLSLMDGKGWL